MEQLNRVYELLTDERNLIVPIILGNSVLLDMLQDYLNECLVRLIRMILLTR